MKLILLVLLGALMQAARSFAPQSGLGSSAGALVLATGFLLLSATLAGDLFKDLKLPRLTGYLALGILAGPHVLDLVSGEMVVDLRVFNGVAIALIALTAGLELHFASLRPLFKPIAAISLVAVCGTMVLLAVAIFFLKPLFPFLAGLNSIETAAVAAVLAVALSSQSPAVVVALRNETGAKGPMVRTVLGVVVLADLLVLTLFAIASSVAQAVLEGRADALATAGKLAYEIFGSGAAGLLIGGMLAAFFRYAAGGGALFLVVVGFVVAEVGQRIHLDPLLIALSAGMLIRNTTAMGRRLLRDLEAASLPVYVAFFSVTGAAIHIDVLPLVGLPALILVVLRALGFLGGTRLAAGLTNAPPAVRRYAGFGLLPQAGLALALALLLERTFPQLGSVPPALLFAAVAMNEMISPILYRLAILRSGEAAPSEATANAEIPAEAMPG